VAITAAQWKRVVQPLLGDNDGWAFQGKLVYRTPVGWLLRGVHAGGSGFRRDHVYVQFVYMPLFVPSDFLVLSYGDQVPNGASAFVLDDLPGPVGEALAQVPHERAGLSRIVAAGQSEAACYSLLLLGREKRARKALEAPYAPGDDRPFVQASRERMKQIHDLLCDAGVDSAVHQLSEWRSATIRAMRIE
jgi:hypothetical protein